MESNGKPSCIHLSQETADILIRMGKSSWLTQREGTIEAKGKGRLQTYFCSTHHGGVPSSSHSSTLYASSTVSGEEEDGDDNDDGKKKANEEREAAPLDTVGASTTPDEEGELENWTNL